MKAKETKTKNYPYLSDIINNHKTQFGKWKIQLIMAFNFISPEETRTMHTRSDNIKIIMGSETNDIIENLRESVLQRYQNRLEESMIVLICFIIVLPHNRAHTQFRKFVND